MVSLLSSAQESSKCSLGREQRLEQDAQTAYTSIVAGAVAFLGEEAPNRKPVIETNQLASGQTATVHRLGK